MGVVNRDIKLENCCKPSPDLPLEDPSADVILCAIVHHCLIAQAGSCCHEVRCVLAGCIDLNNIADRLKGVKLLLSDVQFVRAQGRV